jgi:hypothetical protein
LKTCANTRRRYTSSMNSTARIFTLISLLLATCLSAAQTPDKPQLIRGKRSAQLIYRGYRYTAAKIFPTSKAWECTQHNCRVRLTTSKNGLNVYNFKHHNHPPNLNICEARAARSAMVDAIINSPNQPTTKLCRSELLKIAPASSAHLPVAEHLARNLRRHRAMQRPPLPQSVATLIIPNALTKANEGRTPILTSI